MTQDANVGIGPLAAPERGPAFDAAVPAGGYRWWYLDAISDDGRFALTLIAFVGSVFSPYYAWSGRRDPRDHCAVNVALYGKHSARWTMTERRAAAVETTPTRLRIGPSALTWRSDGLRIDLDEIGAPLPRRVRGAIDVRPLSAPATSFALTPNGGHRWQPIAPRARVELNLSLPDLTWSGDGYFDTNWGDTPLEAAFSGWTWSRAHAGDEVIVLYDTARRNGHNQSMALRFAGHGVAQDAPPPPALLPPTGWRIARSTRADAGEHATVRATLEDTPFYARSLVDTRLFGRPVRAFHESLSLDRFAAPWVRALLPFRMPRRFW